MMRTKKQINDWWKALEAERHDQSYKQPKDQALTQFTKIVYRDKIVDTRFRDDIFYNAGRYAEGARDDSAINANRIARNLIKKGLENEN